MRNFFVALGVVLGTTSPALSQEQATVVLKSGLVVTIESAYKPLIDAMKKGDKGAVLELNVQGSQFLVRLEEIAIVCKERCLAMTVVSPAKR